MFGRMMLLLSFSYIVRGLETEDVVKVTLDMLSAIAPKEMAMLDNDISLKNNLIENITCLVERELNAFRNLTQRQELSTIYSADEIVRFETALEYITYCLNFTEDNGKPLVRFTRFGHDILPPKYIETRTDVGHINDLQIASIVIESVILVLVCVGVRIRLSNPRIVEISYDFITRAMTNTEVRNSIMRFVDEFERATRLSRKASLIFELLQVLGKEDVLWDTIKDICEDMEWYEWLETAGMATATLIAALATDGVALVAKIALALQGAVHFGMKFTNLAYLKSIDVV